ncbi:MAG: tetratricopeptide repeat protein [Verrucomicrobiales bacterium]
MVAHLVSRICAILLLILLCVIVYVNLTAEVPDEEIYTKFGVIIVAAIIGGVLFVMHILPMLSGAVGDMMYSAGGEVEEDPGAKAAAKMAQGDFEGAIAEYQKLYEANPDEKHPITEIAKIQLEKLEDPDAAEATLRGALEDKEWPEDDAAFFMFRLVDISLDHKGDFATARALLEQVQESFPDSRYSANATHRMRELEAAEYKAQQQG